MHGPSIHDENPFYHEQQLRATPPLNVAQARFRETPNMTTWNHPVGNRLMSMQVRAEAQEEIEERESVHAESFAAKDALLYALSRPRGRLRSVQREASRLSVSSARLKLETRTCTNDVSKIKARSQ